MEVSLDKLYLDPNNYRLISEKEYHREEGELRFSDAVQDRTATLVAGRNNANISDLIDSFKANGFIPMENIQVIEVGDKFLVVEGNRRVTTLKAFCKLRQENKSMGAMQDFDFNHIPVVIVKDAGNQHLIRMGLHHISGKKRWNAVNQAQLIKDLVNSGMTADEICKSLGLSKMAVNRSLRTLALINAYKDSDFGDQFETDRYTIFDEIIKSPKIKTWLDWDESAMRCGNTERQERLFSWISKVEENVFPEEDADQEDSLLPEQISTLEPIITRYTDIRELSDFINDEAALLVMEKSRSLSQAKRGSKKFGEDQVQEALEAAQYQIRQIVNFSGSLYDKDTHALRRMIDTLSNLHSIKTIENRTALWSSQVCFSESSSRFSQVEIKRYRGIDSLVVNDLRDINLFVGSNNNGKTRLLEAIYMLTLLNHTQRHLDLERLRTKADKVDIKDRWLLAKMSQYSEVCGTFCGRPVSSQTKVQADTESEFDKTGYIRTIHNHSLVDDKVYNSRSNYFSNKDAETFVKDTRALCRSLFTTPYHSNHTDLMTAYSTVVNENKKSLLIEYLKESFYPDLKDIQLINDDNSQNGRFVVELTSHEKPLDLTRYGEGMQRVFEISLYILASQYGCVFIDEIDSGLHKSLMQSFVNYVCKIAVENNVQLFVSTHNKECVDAFIQGDRGDQLMVYRLEQQGRTVKQSSGRELQRLMQSFDIDVR